jgi:hypothetical protein
MRLPSASIASNAATYSGPTMNRRLLASLPTCLAGLLLLTACDAGAPVTGHPDATVPTPSWAPSPAASPAGRVQAVAGVPQAVAFEDGGTGRVAVISADTESLIGPDGTLTAVPLDDPEGMPPRSVVAVPGGGFRAVAAYNVLLHHPGATAAGASTLPAAGGAIAAPPTGDWIAVALPDRGDVVILDAAARVVRTIHTGGRPSALAADDTRLAVLDTTQSSLAVYDVARGEREQAMRAGDGAAAVVAAGNGRFAVVDARDGELLVYDTGPLVLRQRFPVRGGAWAAAADAKRGVVWVTLTQRNEVAAFDVSGGTPREVARHATVRLPLAVAVDPATGTVAVAGVDLVQRIPS